MSESVDPKRFIPLRLQNGNTENKMSMVDETNRVWLAYSRFDVVGLVLGKQRLLHEEAKSEAGVRIEKFPEGFHARVRVFCCTAGACSRAS